MTKINKYFILFIVLFIWLTVASVYAYRSVWFHRSSDHWGQLQYAEIIVRENRLPFPREGRVTYNPPLYYFINSLLFPESIKGNNTLHINSVRAMSIVYGAIAIVFMWWLLNLIGLNPCSQMVSLLFVSTTPMFVFEFSTYNNDSLSTMLGIATIAISYALVQKWSIVLAILLFVLTLAGCFTKYTYIWCIIVISVMYLLNFLKFKLPDHSQRKIIFILFLAFIIFLVKWLLPHNYYHAGKLFPFNDEELFMREFSVKEIFHNAAHRFKIPFIQESAIVWKEPFIFPHGGIASKRNNFWSYSFVSSVMAEWIYTKPHLIFIWSMLLIHLLANIIGFLQIFKGNIPRLAFALILFGNLLQATHILRLRDDTGLGFAMAYRYIAWTWIGWVVLYSYSLSSKSKLVNWIVGFLLATGILNNIYFLMTVEGDNYY
jgi:hypothetical protein